MNEKTPSKKTPAKKAAPAKAAPAKAARPAAKAQKAPAAPAKKPVAQKPVAQKPGMPKTPEGIESTLFEQVITACLLDNRIREILYTDVPAKEVAAQLKKGRVLIREIAGTLGAPPAAIGSLVNALSDDDLLAFGRAASSLNRANKVGA